MTTYQDVLDAIKLHEVTENEIYSQLHDYKKNHPMLCKGTILDYDKSVNWNRDEVAQRNLVIQSQLSAYRYRLSEETCKVIGVFLDYIKDEYQFSEDLAKLIYGKAYEDGHSAGYYEVLHYINEYSEFAQKCIELSSYQGVE